MAELADGNKLPTIGEQLGKAGVSRRDLVEFCTKRMIAAPIGLAITKEAWAGEVAKEVASCNDLLWSGWSPRIAPAAPRLCCAPRVPVLRN